MKQADQSKSNDGNSGTPPPGRIEGRITPELIAMITGATGLAYDPEITEGNVCLAGSSDVRPEYRLAFTKADLQRYLYAATDDNGTIPPPQDADAFWQMVEVGNERMSH